MRAFSLPRQGQLTPAVEVDRVEVPLRAGLASIVTYREGTTQLTAYSADPMATMECCTRWHFGAAPRLDG